MLLGGDYKYLPKHVGVVVYEQVQFVGNTLTGCVYCAVRTEYLNIFFFFLTVTFGNAGWQK